MMDAVLEHLQRVKDDTARVIAVLLKKHRPRLDRSRAARPQETEIESGPEESVTNQKGRVHR